MIACTPCYHAAAASTAGWTTHSVSGLLNGIAVPVAVLLQQLNQRLRLRIDFHTITYVLLLHIAVSTMCQVRLGVSRPCLPSSLRISSKPRPVLPLSRSYYTGELVYSMYPSRLRLTAAFLLQSEVGEERRPTPDACRCELSVRRDQAVRDRRDLCITVSSVPPGIPNNRNMQLVNRPRSSDAAVMVGPGVTIGVTVQGHAAREMAPHAADPHVPGMAARAYVWSRVLGSGPLWRIPQGW